MDIDTQRFHARSMRKNMPGAERKLWVALRNRALGGHKFQRQAEIGPYIVDFLCRERAVIVEIDGDTHSTDSEIAHDRQRSAFLKVNGYAMFRAWNSDVYTNLIGVLDGLLMLLEARERRFQKRARRDRLRRLALVSLPRLCWGSGPLGRWGISASSNPVRGTLKRPLP
jgi:very-short-patch-repair endonuclease